MLIPSWRFASVEDELNALHPAEVRRECRLFADSMMAGVGGNAYQIVNSLLFRGGQSLYKAFTSSATWGLSLWVRRNRLGAISPILGAAVRFNANDTLTAGSLTTTAVYRDPTAWMHIAVAGGKLYVNGADMGAITTSAFTCSATNCLGYDGTNHLNAEVTEFTFTDGSQPSSAPGRVDTVTGSWAPIPVVGTWGTNGVYLGKPWSSASLGTDYSGKGNHWTPTGFAASDVLKDSPTNVYATLNPLNKDSAITVSSGNLLAQINSSNGAIWATYRIDGPVYAEVTTSSISSGGTQQIGIAPLGYTSSQSPYYWPNAYVLDVSYSARKGNNGTLSAYGSYVPANGKRYMIAFDPAKGNLWFGCEGVWISGGNPESGENPSFSGVPASMYFSFISGSNTVSGEHAWNFGQRPFAFTPPTGFKALCTANLPAPVSAAAKQPGKYYSCQLVTHNGTSTAFTLGWNPDPANGGSHTLFRIKSLSTGSWYWIDTVRGLSKYLNSDSTASEGTNANILTAAPSTGVCTLGTGLGSATYLVEAWRVAPEAGLDIVLDTGTGANKTITHNNGTTPALVIRKGRTGSGAAEWPVWHQALGAVTNTLVLNSTAGTAGGTTYFDGSMTAATIGIGAGGSSNTSGTTYITYVWSEVPGFSAFRQHTGNGSTDGPFDWLGFTPGAATIKRSDSTTPWLLFDAVNNPVNVAGNRLVPNSSVAMNDSGMVGTASQNVIDMLSGAIKMRAPDSSVNYSGGTYIYAAWAKAPLGAKNITPATAR